MENTFDWQTEWAAIWRPTTKHLRAVQRLDSIQLSDLLGIDLQKRALIKNTERFLKGEPAQHALLWGSRGTGKSSLIKALLNQYASEGLRVIEIDKDHLQDLLDIVDELSFLPQHFIVFCDDLSFEDGETTYKQLKSVLEGSIELPPENILIYATSNRRHLISEYASDNKDTRIINGALHHADIVEEKLSLSDRFGLWLSFYPNSQLEYLEIVDHLFANYSGDREELHLKAKQFAMMRASRSGRTARQFYRDFSAE
ncbi:MAG: ATP-binding protein [Pseudomonadota bacterium]